MTNIKALTIINSSATAPTAVPVTPVPTLCTLNLTLATGIKLTTLTSIIRPSNVVTITTIVRGERTTVPASISRTTAKTTKAGLERGMNI